MHVDNKVALITGASRGIGRATALELAKAGAKIVINYAGNAAAAQEVLKAIQDMGGQAIAVQANIAVAAEVDELIQKTVTAFGSIDILVNNAGITRDALLMRMKEADWDAVLDTNLKGVFLCTKAVSKLMLKQRSGRIINMTSVVGLTGNASQANYAAAKAGVVGFTKSMAKELGSRGITVNAVAPGFIATDMTEVLPDSVKEQMTSTIPLGRPGTPSDVAKAVLFLCSDAAAYITGQTLNVDGGMVMY
ncbi:3-oxoacyl-[acyl-carrier-protein] reductase [Anaeromusa sp.]|jgi:3-oxoacyl-[acyl-carrier protein] reductase|uniref:3-oxoacyl-[acyl-carrier-protein] reductase n=1 Tax=Anaeromusa sp. TaxID=1872520 RepID=UPI0026283B75|nr:3-oxoacyl-[acyl-carrier-protein] reductase [Anaeromusa sp.]MDD3158278.1 3-oxoacyl-[acyl-carrier-protein] reductase [Anaeromusa sp.]MEA4833644.1 3-oxoacyl-[acyl-carrier-protein] reductase [Anaeromusa sp.]